MNTVLYSRRILALHGYLQSSNIFSIKTGRLRKQLKKHKIDILYPNAPLIISDNNNINSNDDNNIKRAWWNIDNNMSCNNEEESFKELSNILQNNDPFEGIIGFSQGGVAASILSIFHKNQRLVQVENIKYYIFISSFIPPCKRFRDLYFKDYINTNNKISIPTLHIYGNNDEFVSKEQSLEFANIFTNPTIYEHNGKHYVPSDKNTMNIISNFIDKSLERQE